MIWIWNPTSKMIQIVRTGGKYAFDAHMIRVLHQLDGIPLVGALRAAHTAIWRRNTELDTASRRST